MTVLLQRKHGELAPLLMWGVRLSGGSVDLWGAPGISWGTPLDDVPVVEAVIWELAPGSTIRVSRALRDRGLVRGLDWDAFAETEEPTTLKLDVR